MNMHILNIEAYITHTHAHAYLSTLSYKTK